MRSGKPSRISGYALRFDSDTNMGDFKERVMPSALKDLDEFDIIATINHDDQSIIGRRSSGNLELSVDSRGLKYSVALNPDSPRQVQVAQDIKDGLFAGSSYEFRVPRGGDEMRGDTRIINRMSIRQVGPVIFPANPATNIEARNKEAADKVADSIKRKLYILERMK